jgi:hypothetical protein
MFLTKLKLAAVTILLIMAGSAVVFSQATAQKPSSRSGIVGNPTAPAKGAEDAAPRDDELDVVMLERAWADAIPRRDAAVVSRILADDFEGIDQVGNLITKATYLPDLRNGLFTTESIELDEIKTRLFGETAVVTSRIKVKKFPTWGRMTNVYVKRRGRWQCVASHASWVAGSTCPATGTPLGVGWTSVRHTRQVVDHAFRPMGWANACLNCHAVSHQPSEPQPLPKPQELQPLPQAREVQPLPLQGVLQPQKAHQTTRIQPRFACQVEKVRVGVGEVVKKGDPLLDLLSTDLAAAKNDFQTAYVQWKHDERLLKMREGLFKNNAISEQVWLESQNNERKSRLAYATAREKLKLFGVPDEQIDPLIKDLASDQHQPEERPSIRDKARLTLRSPVDGIVIEVGAMPGNMYDKKDNLIVIRPRLPEKPAVP